MTTESSRNVRNCRKTTSTTYTKYVQCVRRVFSVVTMWYYKPIAISTFYMLLSYLPQPSATLNLKISIRNISIIQYDIDLVWL